MKVLTIRRRSGELQRILKAAKRRDVILRPPQGGEMLLSFIDDFDYEVAAQRRNPKLMAFLEQRLGQARKEKGAPLEEARRRLGLPLRANGRQPVKPEAATAKVSVSARSKALLELLEKALREETILKTANGAEYVLLPAGDGDYKAANQRRSEAVMAYLDALGEKGKRPPLEVVFVRELPRSSGGPVKKVMRKSKKNQHAEVTR